MKVKIPKPTLIDITKLIRHPNNLKKHTEAQITTLTKLIEMVGFKDPIVIDKNFNVKAGHGRLEAAEKLEMTEVPCIFIEGMTQKQMDLFMWLDNHVNESPWIQDNIDLIFEDMPLIDLEQFPEINWDNIIPTEEIKEGPIPEPPKEPKSKLGEIYQLGDHRIMCGDCTNSDHLKCLLEEKTVDLLLTDPPYGVNYSGKNEYLNKITKPNRIQTPIINDDINDYLTFFENFLKIIPFSSYNIFYIFMGDTELASLVQALTKLNFFITSYLIWNKNRMIFGRKDYHSKHEIILYGWKNRHKFYGPKNRVTVIDYDTKNVNDLHPTMKPIEILAQLTTDGSQKEMLVYDPFLGSGSTLIACEHTNRICFGMEIDPGYVDVIIQRFENFTGKKARKL